MRGPARAGPEQTFAPPSRQGAWYAAAAAVPALLLALALLARAVTLGISFATVAVVVPALVLVVAGGCAAYWAWAALTLRYELRDGILSIRWGLLRHDLPVALFQRVVRGARLGSPTVQGLDWPGCHIGHASVPRIGAVRFLSLHRTPAEVLYLAGDREAYAISVANPSAFIRALQAQDVVDTAGAAARIELHPALALLRWRDPPVQRVLAVAVALAALATAVVFSRYAGFPDRITLNFPEETRVGERTALLGIPAAAWLLLLLNAAIGLLLARGQRAAAYIVLCGLAFVEALLVVAAVTAV